jgi:hypothetical protein
VGRVGQIECSSWHQSKYPNSLGLTIEVLPQVISNLNRLSFHVLIQLLGDNGVDVSLFKHRIVKSSVSLVEVERVEFLLLNTNFWGVNFGHLILLHRVEVGEIRLLNL